MSLERGVKKCPDCGGASYIAPSPQIEQFNKALRKFSCSDCGTIFYVLINDPELLKYYDRVMGRT